MRVSVFYFSEAARLVRATLARPHRFHQPSKKFRKDGSQPSLPTRCCAASGGRFSRTRNSIRWKNRSTFPTRRLKPRRRSSHRHALWCVSLARTASPPPPLVFPPQKFAKPRTARYAVLRRRRVTPISCCPWMFLTSPMSGAGCVAPSKPLGRRRRPPRQTWNRST